MKKIKLANYNSSMGTLIDVSDPQEFASTQIQGSKNVPYQKLLLYYKEFLNPKKPYFLICSKGLHSARATAMLEYYGYNVTQVVR